ncbi:MAG: response regulator [Deferribacteraceae bacterium]|nr:response regulator [Deferribacteraceae bacterium]
MRSLTVASLICLLFFFCAAPALSEGWAPPNRKNYLSIPGITESEIKAVEKLKGERAYFVLGSVLSENAFYSGDASIKGFSAHFSELLTEIFGIPFVPKVYSWNDLYDGLVLEDIDFTAEFYTDFYGSAYFATTPLLSRSVKVLRPKNAPLFSEIRYSKPLKIGLIKDIPTYEELKSFFDFKHTTLRIWDTEAAYNLLLSGELDAIITDDSSRMPIDLTDEINVEDFYPLIYTKTSFATYNRELEPIISIFQKYINSFTSKDFEKLLMDMKKEGELDFLRYRLFRSLTPAETQLINRYTYNKKVVMVQAASENYPIIFFDQQSAVWRGIAVDALNEIAGFTGLTFAPYEGRLSDNDAEMSVEVVRTNETENNYLWTDLPFFSNTFALISKASQDDISISRVWRSKVGIVNNTPYMAVFKEWFPKHTGLYIFEDYKTLLSALDRGDVDCIMGSRSLLMNLTSFHGRIEVRANLTFDYPFNSYFAFKKDQELLRSIVNKSMQLVDLERIAADWNQDVFDYRAKLAGAVLPFLVALLITLTTTIFFLVYFLKKRKNINKKLEEAVEQRTQELLEQTKAAEGASRVKSEFLANISHEIRTPLNAIIGLGELELMKKLPKDTHTNIEKIFSSGKTLLSIINDVLDISKIESGKVEIIEVAYELASLINDTIHINIVRIGSKPIAFVLDIDESLPIKLLGDELRVKQIINNLLSNAFKYTKYGTVTLSIHREGDNPLQQGEPIQLNISVKDTGQGIKEDDMPKLFSKYNQLDTRANRKIEGTGLGLSICLNFVKMMGGEISVESEFGRGSTFSLTINQKIVDPSPIGYETVENLRKFRTVGQRKGFSQDIVKVYMPYGKVLVVDDVPTNLDVVKGMMLPYGLMMDFALSGMEAIEMIKAEKLRYDVIFMDHMMPNMDGIEAVKIIRNEINTEYARTVPILAFTANALIGNEELFLAHGFQGFLSKPLDAVKLDEALNKWVRNRERESEVKIVEDNAIRNPTLLKTTIEGLNIKKGVDRFGGNSESYITVLRSYLTNTTAIIESLKAVKPENIKDYAIRVHGIKGSSYSIGADLVGDMAEQLELAAKSDEYEYISATNIFFINKLEELLEKLRLLITSLDSETPAQTTKPAPDKELLAQLLEACQRVDIDEIENCIANLEKFRYENDDNLIVWLRGEFDKFEFDSIINRLSTELGVQINTGG